MLAETFLKDFALLAAGPGGIRKLRELVLNLAISGRLSEQRSEDGHAKVLVEAAGTAIKSAIKSGTIRKPKFFEKAAVGRPEIPIPASWVNTRLADLGLISPRNEAPDEVAAGFVPMAAIEAKFGPQHGFEERPWADIKKGYTHVANGDVVLAKITPCFENGKSAVITGLPNGLGAGTTELHVFRQLALVVEPDYVLAFLKSESFIQAGVPRMTGTAGQKRIPADYFALSPFPLPPLAEQQRIVAKVNELMALCDALEARQDKGTAQKRAAADSALHHLTEAKTPEEAADRWSLLGSRFGELFDDLETIKALREALIELALQGQFTSFDRASQWPKRVFSEVAEIRSGVTKGRKLQGAEIISVPYLRVANVQRGFVDTKEVKAIEIGAHELDRFSLRRGDVLQIEGGDWDKVGRAALWNGEIDPCVHQNHVFSSRPADELMSEFVVLWMNSPETKRYFISCSKQTTNLASINKTQLSNTPIVVPPLAEQRRIVVKVDTLMALCDRLEEQVCEGERLSAELMASLVHALTETDPDGGGAVEPVNAPTNAAPEQANMNAPETPGTKSARTASKPKPETRATPDRALGVDTKFHEAVLVAAITNTFFQAGGEPIGNFRLQKAVYFARRKMGEHVGEMAYLKKAAGPYNPSMKYSGGIAIAKQKNWLREARGRFGFGHVPGPDVGDASEWIDTYGYEAPARWVAEHFRYKKNEEWETLATTDYAIEHLQTFGIEVGAAQILQYIASDPEWRPKIEKLRLTEMSVATAMLEVQALFSAEGRDDSV